MKTRVMSIRGDSVEMRAEFTGEGKRRFLLLEDYADGVVVKRVRVPLYGGNVRCLLFALRKWKLDLLEEAEEAMR